MDGMEIKRLAVQYKSPAARGVHPLYTRIMHDDETQRLRAISKALINIKPHTTHEAQDTKQSSVAGD